MAKSTATPGKSEDPPDPRDSKALGDWLANQPTEWSVTIAARAALRVLPLDTRDIDDRLAIVLPVFRATAIARFAAKYPNRAAVVSAATYASVASASASAAAASAASVVASAYRAATSAASAVHSVSAALLTSIAIAVHHDAHQLHEGATTPEKLAAAPLWLTLPPSRIGGAWEGLAPDLRASGAHWSVWINWYDDVLAGEVTSEAADAAFTDIPGKLPWDEGAEAVNTEIARRLRALRPDPTPLENIPSPIAISRMADGRIGANAGALGETALPASLTPEDHARALAACRSRAEQLRTLAASPKFQGRSDYAEALAAYLEWLPSAPGSGNILLADGEARVLNKLFTADEGILPTGFAGRLSVLLEDHIGLRPHYPELERHYEAVRTGRLTTPLSRDAVEGIRQAIHANTPDVFHESVSPAMDETAKLVPDVKPPLPEDAPPPDPTRPKPPKDPIAEVDPVKSRNFAFASGANRIWEILRKGKDVQQGFEGWQKTYDQFKPHIGTIIDWLKDFWPGGGDGMSPM
jgi:hypothetical protein